MFRNVARDKQAKVGAHCARWKAMGIDMNCDREGGRCGRDGGIGCLKKLNMGWM
jgi:hypothetical protein